MAEVLDWYGILGVKETAPLSEIRAAFKKKTIELHPDRNPDKPNCADIWLSVRKAWDILSDEKAKAAYDAVLKVKAARQQRDKESQQRRQSRKSYRYVRR